MHRRPPQGARTLLLVTMLATLPVTAGAARALDPELELSALVVERWTTERGLPQNSVNDLLQTRDGYLWVATFGGLARFDGVAFRVFDGEGSSGLPSSRILALLEDRSGRLWVGTQEGGVAVLDGERFVDPLPEPLADPIVWSLAEDPEGAIWIATGSGVVRFAGGRLTSFGTAQGLPAPWVRGLRVGPRGELWAATEGGVARFDGERFAPVSALPAWAVELARGAPIASGESALVELDTGRVRVARPEGRPEALGRALHVDRSGAVWIGGERLARWRPGASVLDVDPDDRFRAPIKALLEDREGNLWVGTDGSGLFELRGGAARSLGPEEGLVGDSALPIVEDARGRIWIGTLCGGLTVFENDGLRAVEMPEVGPGRPCISALEVGRDGALWVGHLGLLRLDRERWSVLADGGESGTVSALLEDRRGRVWMTSDRGLFRVTPEDRLEPIPELAGERLWGLAELPDGRLALGGEGRVTLLEPGAPPRRIELEGPRARVPVRDFWQAPSGALWAATYGSGLARVDLDGGGVSWVRAEQGLVESFLSRILPDDAGRIWLSGNRGLYRIEAGQLEPAAAGGPPLVPRVVGVDDGMRVAEANGGGRPAGWRASDGRLWFPTVRGVAVVDPDRLEANPLAPPVHVEEVALEGRVLPAAAGLELPGGAGRIEIRYTGIGLTRPERVRFRHRLVGYDSEWQPAGTRRFAVFTGLSPGRYRFEVLAANEDGVWSPAPATLSFSVAPLWFQTPSFRLAVLAVALAALWGLHRLWLLRLHRRQSELENEVAARTVELSELNQNLSRIVSEQTDQIRETRDMAILTLAKLAELRDGTTGEHLDRIALYSRRLAEALADGPFGPLGEDFIEELFRSSPLHDIGKVAIPDQILKKPGPLTDREREIMRTHTTIGGDTLGRVVERSASHSFLAMGREIAYGHHERWDGSGYPAGHAGERVPVPARIVALVDAYDAITSARPYKPAFPHLEAVARIERDRGAHFDPRLVDAFLAIHEDLDRIRREHPTIAA